MFGIVCNEYVVPCQIVNLILQKYVFKKNKKQAFQQKIETSHKKMAFPKITLNARNMKHIYSSHWIRNNNKNKKRNITQIHCPYCLHLCCQMVNPILLPFYFYRTCKSDFFFYWILNYFLFSFEQRSWSKHAGRCSHKQMSTWLLSATCRWNKPCTQHPLYFSKTLLTFGTRFHNELEMQKVL